ncbi:MAG: hypothetical protein Q9182_004957 [Xanthomendoza sp. 2 TL-2023]
MSLINPHDTFIALLDHYTALTNNSTALMVASNDASTAPMVNAYFEATTALMIASNAQFNASMAVLGASIALFEASNPSFAKHHAPAVTSRSTLMVSENTIFATFNVMDFIITKLAVTTLKIFKDLRKDLALKTHTINKLNDEFEKLNFVCDLAKAQLMADAPNDFYNAASPLFASEYQKPQQKRQKAKARAETRLQSLMRSFRDSEVSSSEVDTVAE